MQLVEQGNKLTVAPLAGSVDRNLNTWPTKNKSSRVAPLAGSVDRNCAFATYLTSSPVAPLAGSVDRNKPLPDFGLYACGSLPSRGAWIEIGVYKQGSRWRARRSPRGERG